MFGDIPLSFNQEKRFLKKKGNVMFGDIEERYELAKNRICEIPDEITAGKNSGGFDYLDFFIDRAKYISFVLDQRKEGRNEETDNAEVVDQTDKAEINFML